MLLATWNVNSLNARMPRVLEFLAAHRPDVVALQETKCAPEQFPHLELAAAGYTSVDHSGGRWAGVALLVRDDHEPTDVHVGLPDTPDLEARWVEATVAGVHVASVYVVNGRALDDPMFAVKLQFLDRLRDRVVALGDRALVVTGDFNIAPRDEDVWSMAAMAGSTHVTPEERAKLTGLAELGLLDAWDVAPERGPERFTWWDYRAGMFHKDQGLRIDLALVSPQVRERLAWVGIDREFRKGTKPSDHAPLLVRLDPS